MATIAAKGDPPSEFQILLMEAIAKGHPTDEAKAAMARMPASSTTPPSASTGNSSTASEVYAVEIFAIEKGMAVGRSLFSNMLGEAALIRCELVGRVTGPRIKRDLTPYRCEFQIFAGGASLESLSGVSRENGQHALGSIHSLIVRDGWSQKTSGPAWYSYRYAGNSAVLSRTLS
jgi:hypothetical protein